jgi:hypothetical protein
MKWMLLSLLILPGVLLSQRNLSNKKIKLPNALYEVSGLWQSGPDSLWWLNDSGNTAELFMTDQQGNLLSRVEVPHTINRDWEDLTADSSGHLYIGDFGNNANRRKDLCIYRYHLASGQVDSITYSYPDQTQFPPPPGQSRYEMEAMVWYQNELHLFSKDRVGKGMKYTKHYTLPDTPGAYTARLVDSLALKKRVVTAAAIDPATGKLALLTYNFRLLLGFIPLTPTDVFIISEYTDTQFFEGSLRRQKVSRHLLPTQYEAIDFLAPGYLRAASERTIIFRQKAKIIRLKE